MSEHITTQAKKEKIAQLVALGLKPKQIAELLGQSTQSVQYYNKHYNVSERAKEIVTQDLEVIREKVYKGLLSALGIMQECMDYGDIKIKMRAAGKLLDVGSKYFASHPEGGVNTQVNNFIGIIMKARDVAEGKS